MLGIATEVGEMSELERNQENLLLYKSINPSMGWAEIKGEWPAETRVRTTFSGEWRYQIVWFKVEWQAQFLTEQLCKIKIIKSASDRSSHIGHKNRNRTEKGYRSLIFKHARPYG